eukprot:894226-Rhodomonas_salina.3
MCGTDLVYGALLSAYGRAVGCAVLNLAHDTTLLAYDIYRRVYNGMRGTDGVSCYQSRVDLGDNPIGDKGAR